MLLSLSHPSGAERWERESFMIHEESSTVHQTVSHGQCVKVAMSSKLSVELRHQQLNSGLLVYQPQFQELIFHSRHIYIPSWRLRLIPREVSSLAAIIQVFVIRQTVKDTSHIPAPFRDLFIGAGMIR